MAIEDIFKMVRPEFAREIEKLEEKVMERKTYFNTTKKIFDSIEDLFRSIPNCDLYTIVEKYDSTINTIKTVIDTLDKAADRTFIPREEADKILESILKIGGMLDREVKDFYHAVCR
jgi:uncharacterized coiled-coil DUF342 family protein